MTANEQCMLVFVFLVSLVLFRPLLHSFPITYHLFTTRYDPLPITSALTSSACFIHPTLSASFSVPDPSIFYFRERYLPLVYLLMRYDYDQRMEIPLGTNMLRLWFPVVGSVAYYLSWTLCIQRR